MDSIFLHGHHWRIWLFAIVVAMGAMSSSQPIAAAPTAPANAAPGYFLVFSFAGGRVQAPAVMATSRYVAGQAVRQDKSWKLRLLDASGKELVATALDNPFALAPLHGMEESDVRLSARVPQLPQAARLELLDEAGVVAWAQAIDADFRARAKAAAADAASLAAAVQAPHAVAADDPARARMAFGERVRQAQLDAAMKAANAVDADPETRAAAAQRWQQLQNPAAARDASSRAAALANESGTTPHAAPLAAPAGSAADATYLLSGNVQTADAKPIAGGTVRAYRSDTGAYAGSGRPDPTTGRYEINLPAGTYDIEYLLASSEYLSGKAYVAAAQDSKILYLAPQRVASIAVAGATTQDFTITPPTRKLTLSVKRSALAYYAPSVSIDIAQGGNLLAREAFNYFWDSSVRNADGTATYTWTVAISPDVYDFTVEAASDGVATKTFSGIDLSQGDQTILFDTGMTRAWKGRLLDSAGNAVANTDLTMLDGMARYRSYSHTDADGNFALAAAPGWYIRFPAPLAGSDVSLPFNVTDLGALPSAVQLSRAALEATVNGQTTRVYTGSNPDGQRLRLLFLGDGYTSTRETFTDTNGNGVWDGVLWYDVNQNGVYDSGDYYQVYGNAAAPKDGDTNVGANNEPFVDANADKVPNLDDAATFMLNVQQHTRALLGAPYWSARAAGIQVDAAMLASPQAGLVVTRKGKTIANNQTALGANLDLERGILKLDSTKALQLAEQLSPGFNDLIVLINEPISVGRANQSIGGSPGIQINNGGAWGINPNSTATPHELGHFLGKLNDEYVEFYTAPPNPPIYYTGGANIAADPGLAALPWAALVPTGQATPDAVPRPGIGVFEGGAVYSGGFYRPSWNSMMNTASWDYFPFNAPSIAALDAGFRSVAGFVAPPVALNQRGLGGAWYNPSTGGQGMIAEVLPDQMGPGKALFFAGWYTFDVGPAGGEEKQRWYAVQGELDNGSADATVGIYTGYGGNFNAPPKVGATKVGQATLTFTDCGTGRFDYQFDDGRRGSFPLARLGANASCTVNGDSGAAGLNLLSGSWYNADTSGQGIVLDLIPSQSLALAGWYTFAQNGSTGEANSSQRWYVLQGTLPQTLSVGQTVTLPIYTGTGGIFDNPTPITRQVVGTAALSFTDCSHATLSYTFTAGGNSGLSSSVVLQRLAAPSSGCKF
jgi:hypothetical protein